MSPRTKSPAELWKTVVDAAHGLPGIEIGTCYGTPALRVKGKFLARFREDNESLVIKVLMVEKDHLMRADPKVFFTTPHYDGYESVLIHLSKVKPKVLRELLEQAWRRAASKKLIAAFDAREI